MPKLLPLVLSLATLAGACAPPPEALVATGTPGALTAPPPRLVPLDPLLAEAAESRIEPADAAALAARAARLRATAARQ